MKMCNDVHVCTHTPPTFPLFPRGALVRFEDVDNRETSQNAIAMLRASDPDDRVFVLLDKTLEGYGDSGYTMCELKQDYRAREPVG